MAEGIVDLLQMIATPADEGNGIFRFLKSFPDPLFKAGPVEDSRQAVGDGLFFQLLPQ